MKRNGPAVYLNLETNLSKQPMSTIKITTSVLVFLSLCTFAVSARGVKAWEGTIKLPTYRVDPPEKAPLFERDFAYQRAKRSVYPYPMNDNPTVEKVDSVHRALYLENDYLKVCVLPDLGGRLFYATDKTNGYEVFYRQHVIKPANVGMLGAWISGGVEWNAFHHHRATSQFPIDYTITDNGDGSKTVWVGEVEKRHGMSWEIGLTLFPDKSYIQVTGRFFNTTADRNSMLHWNNVATHANENYQIIFPESTEFGMFHHKSSFIHWPVPQEPYKGNPDYIGKNISWWKNLPSLTGDSVFICDLQDDFVGGYDHGIKAGTMLVGDHNINKGGKFWTWGHLNYGHAWDCVTLTDEDGPYVELMTSAYSDNQPDYCWINPGETKEFTAWWYGIRDLENVNRGNREATVNMDIDPSGKVHVAANVTSVRKNAVIRVESGGTVLYEKTASIAPDRPFSDDFTAESSLLEDPAVVRMHLLSAEGEELISYHPCRHDLSKPVPEGLKPVNPDPGSVENIEELYYIGMRNLQFHQAHVDPNDYFLEVLRRDPGDVRSNTQMGIYHRKNGEYDKAAAYLRKALQRQTANYTRVADGEAMYNLGLVLKAQGKFDEATDTLYRAAWDYEYASASYYALSQISSIRGNTEKALQEALMAVSYNGMNIAARNLLTSLLRTSGRKAEAVVEAKAVRQLHPLDYYACSELVKMGAIPRKELDKILQGRPESLLDLAVGYLDNGFPEDCRKVLLESEGYGEYPTTEYYLGWLSHLDGDPESALSWFSRAEGLGTDYVFPFRLETVPVLRTALEYLPKSANTWFYLGNLLYQKQPEEAMRCWEKAVDADSQFAMALRNLGWGCRFFLNDLEKAEEYYLRAIGADKDGNAIFLAECDEIMELRNAPLQDRYKLFAGRTALYQKRYDSETRAIRQRILHGEYEEVLEPLLSRHFSRREHIEDLHDIYVDACLLSGLKASEEGDGEKALHYMLLADEYPENHGYAHLEYNPRDAQVWYNIGLAYEKVGNPDEASKYYRMAAGVEIRPKDAIYNYEKGLAMKKIEPRANVRPLYREMVSLGRDSLTDYVQRFFESFDRGPYERDVNSSAWYQQGLGWKALGRGGKARRCFKKSLQERNDNLWANHFLYSHP